MMTDRRWINACVLFLTVSMVVCASRIDAHARDYVYGLGSSPLVEVTDDGVTQINIRLPGRLVAVAAQTGGRYLLQDHLGSTTVFTGSGTAPDTVFDYTPYGDVTAYPGGADPALPATNYLFQGHEYEPELSLYNFKARLYSPGAALFLSTDPAGTSISPYSPFGRNPVNYVDINGLSPKLVLQIAGGKPPADFYFGALSTALAALEHEALQAGGMTEEEEHRYNMLAQVERIFRQSEGTLSERERTFEGDDDLELYWHEFKNDLFRPTPNDNRYFTYESLNRDKNVEPTYYEDIARRPRTLKRWRGELMRRYDIIEFASLDLPPLSNQNTYTNAYSMLKDGGTIKMYDYTGPDDTDLGPHARRLAAAGFKNVKTYNDSEHFGLTGRKPCFFRQLPPPPVKPQVKPQVNPESKMDFMDIVE